MSASNTTTITVTYVLELNPQGRHTGFPGVVSSGAAPQAEPADSQDAPKARRTEFLLAPLPLTQPITRADLDLIVQRLRDVADVAEVAALSNRNFAEEVARLTRTLPCEAETSGELLP